jgi:hypothetical protein
MARKKNVFKSADTPDAERALNITWQALKKTPVDFIWPSGQTKQPNELDPAEIYCIKEMKFGEDGRVNAYVLLDRNTLHNSFLKYSTDNGRGNVNIGIGVAGGQTRYIPGLAVGLESAIKLCEARPELKPGDPGYDEETQNLRVVADMIRDEQLVRAGGVPEPRDVTPPKVIEHVKKRDE